ncbi:Ribose-phosphate pyrophosphokinase 1 [Neolecta irregularis DAH-3]|uniref:Ribose-phosphate pyrophosphokinase 1 n=1 Tax=Neolecta irregularis (strain DAH-3) TaxID=1198029 RepID=A0A1U7LGV6_NEOID|nr:Ribose-phosphate pyrophosphokinase 1 [Neolecta irregularis DAH-3]|eukprot:OLL21890.1 Ribose-phosphate pyrophosphokinase 1 [Neolecta irregularis DAH-3]
MRKTHIFGGSSHPELAKLIAERLGCVLAAATLGRFSNGETSVEIGASVRDHDVYIVQSGSVTVNDHLMELLVLIAAAKGGSARRITAVMPYFPYSKQSKMKTPRGAIAARMVANLLTVAGADHIITMDLHASQMQGFFTTPVDNLYAEPTLVRWIKENIAAYRDCVIVSKNPGGTKRVTSIADALKANFALIHTDRRRGKNSPYPVTGGNSPAEIITSRIISGHVVDSNFPSPGLDHIQQDPLSISVHSTACPLGGAIDHHLSDDEELEDESLEHMITLVGDVSGRVAIVLDDMLDRAGAFVTAAEHLTLNCAAKQVIVIVTHAMFSRECWEKIENCDAITQVVVTNAFPVNQRWRESGKLSVIDVSPVFAEAIRRTHNGESISCLFECD